MVSNKVLAQWEIDSLLGALGGATPAEASAADDPRPVKLYDFRRPDKFAKDHLRALQMVHESFSRQFSTALSSYLRTGVNVHLGSIEQVLYDDYIGQLPNPTLVSLLSMAPLPGRMTLELSLELAFLMLDRLLGGTGRSGRANREFTEIELALVRNMLHYATQSLHDAWANVISLTPRVEEIVLNPQIVQAALSGEAAAMMIIEVKLFDAGGTISLCLPHSMVEPILGRFSAQLLLGSGAHASAEVFNFERPLRDVTLPFAVELGTAQVSVRDLASLVAGDVLRLDTGPADGLKVLVEGHPKFKCVPGMVNRALAVQITEVITDEETAHG